eukprot:m.6700 g.6700  ORF g.6700 m.6700 type:complete len:415 (+) comp2714_c0_seq1:94-1338(+)
MVGGRALALLMLLGVLVATLQPCACDTVVIDVIKQFGGVTQSTLHRAVAAAGSHFASGGHKANDEVVVYIGPGTWVVSPQTDDGFDITGITPGPQGRLVIAGAGMNATTLSFSNRHNHTMRGRHVYRLTVRDIHFTRNYPTVSQAKPTFPAIQLGTIKKIGPGFVDVDIHHGFATPQSLYDPCMTHGRFLREFDTDRDDPKLIAPEHCKEWPPLENQQVEWESVTSLSGALWRFHLARPAWVANFTVGNVAGIKSKQCAQAYWFEGGDDIAFHRVKWTKISRGIFRGGINNIHIADTMILRGNKVGGRTPCMSTYGGGPQLSGDFGAGGNYNITVERHYAEGTGDDSVALFSNVENATISDCYIRDSFARGILLVNSSKAKLRNNVVIRCPIFNTSKLGEAEMDSTAELDSTTA